MQKDVVLIKAEDKKRFFMPYGLLYVASSLKKGDFKPWIFHVHEKEIQETVEKIKGINPILVGFSTLTGGSLQPSVKLSKMIKKLGYPVVWGGVHATFLTELCLKEEFIDFVVRGEGEETALDLANCVMEKKPEELQNIKGLAYKENGQIKINPARDFIGNLDEYEIPWELIDVERYIFLQFGNKRTFPLITSRGCPFRCGFCFNLSFNKCRWRGHSFNYVKNQIDFLKRKFNMEGAFFYDDNFFAGKERSKKIIEEMNLPHFNELRVDIVDDEFVRWLKKSNCQRIFIGVESGSQRILDSIKKDLTLEQIENGVRLLAGAGVEVDLSFIIGTPDETEEDRNMTYDFIDKLQSIHHRSTATIKIYAPYPGTPLWSKSIQKGFQPPKDNLTWAEVTHEKCFLPWVDTKQIETISFVALYSLANIKDTFPKGYRLISLFERLRWKNRFFKFPLELKLIKWGKRSLVKLIKN